MFNIPIFSVWAPTAQNVVLLADPPGGDSTETRVEMVRDQDGIWTVWGKSGWRGGTYRFEVTVYAPSTGKVETNSLAKPELTQPENSTIYELHIRDFSINDTTVPADDSGTYLAFTDGLQHLATPAQAGLNTVHLLPAFDIATLEENRSAQLTPACDLPNLPADSPVQQACVRAVADKDGFNCGYDPLHYTTPEGSSSTNPEAAGRTKGVAPDGRRAQRRRSAGGDGRGLQPQPRVI